MQFIVSDFSAIEARVLAFLAKEAWRTKVFAEGRDIYCESASRMFGVPVEKHGQNAPLRQRGKVAELALGYGGSVGALKAMGALEMGLAEEDLEGLVQLWRQSNPNITAWWWAVDLAAKEAIRLRTPQKVGKIRFEYHGGLHALLIRLPSGRSLTYIRPEIGENRFGGESIMYMGTDAQKHYTRIETYGPKLVENIVQAVSRDILAEAMRNILRANRELPEGILQNMVRANSMDQSAGTRRNSTEVNRQVPPEVALQHQENFRIVGHVHDEVIVECPEGTTVETITREMEKSPAWLPGIGLRCDGYRCRYYMKQ